MIAIIDYKTGNVKSIQNMLKKIGYTSIITNNPEEIEKAEKLILPGVGHFDYGMNNLHHSNLIELLNKEVLENKKLILGICLGAQLLGNASEEGVEKGLGWIDMEVVKFDVNKLTNELKIPNMGWNEIVIKNDNYNLFEQSLAPHRFYFVHSYHMLPRYNENILTTSVYGYEFVSGVIKNNIIGVQFHPEKSHKYGMSFLSKFCKL